MFELYLRLYIYVCVHNSFTHYSGVYSKPMGKALKGDRPHCIKNNLSKKP